MSLKLLDICGIKRRARGPIDARDQVWTSFKLLENLKNLLFMGVRLGGAFHLCAWYLVIIEKNLEGSKRKKGGL